MISYGGGIVNFFSYLHKKFSRSSGTAATKASSHSNSKNGGAVVGNQTAAAAVANTSAPSSSDAASAVAGNKTAAPRQELFNVFDISCISMMTDQELEAKFKDNEKAIKQDTDLRLAAKQQAAAEAAAAAEENPTLATAAAQTAAAQTAAAASAAAVVDAAAQPTAADVAAQSTATVEKYGGVKKIADDVINYVFENDKSEQSANNASNQTNVAKSFSCSASANAALKNCDTATVLGAKFRSSSAFKAAKFTWLGGMLSLKGADVRPEFKDIITKFEELVDNAINHLMVPFGDDKKKNIDNYAKAMTALEELLKSTTKYNSLGLTNAVNKNTSEINIIIREIGSTAMSCFDSLVIAKESFANADAKSQKLNSFADIVRYPDKLTYAQGEVDPKEIEKNETSAERKVKISRLQSECSELRQMKFQGIDDSKKAYRVTDFKKKNDFLNPNLSKDSDAEYFYGLASRYENILKTSKDRLEKKSVMTKMNILKTYIKNSEEYCVKMFKLSQLLREENPDMFSQNNKDSAVYFKNVRGDVNLAKNYNAINWYQEHNTPGYSDMTDETKMSVPYQAVDYFYKKTKELFEFSTPGSSDVEYEQAPKYDPLTGNILEPKDVIDPVTGETIKQNYKKRFILKGGKATEEEYRSLWKYTGYSASINALAAGFKGGSYTGDFLGDDIDFDEHQRGKDNNMDSIYNDAEDLRNLTSLISKSSYDDDVWLQSAQSYAGFQSFLGISASSKMLEDMCKSIEKSASVKNRNFYACINSFNSDEIVEANQKMKKYIGYMNEMPQFMSTTIYKGGGGGFNAGAKVKLNIFAPKGSEMLYVADMGHYGSSEQEVILQRGGTYSISDIYWSFDDSVNKTTPVLMVDMEIHPEHGYNKRQQEPKKSKTTK